jgi:hypothetical protein
MPDAHAARHLCILPAAPSGNRSKGTGIAVRRRQIVDISASWPVMGTAIAIGAIVAANVIILTHLHQSVSRDEHRNLLRQSLVLSAIVERTFQSVDLVLTSVVEKVRLAAATGGGVGQLTNQSTQAFLGPNTLVFRHEEGPE